MFLSFLFFAQLHALLLLTRAKKLSSSQEAQLRHIVLQESPKSYLKKEIFGH